MSGRPSSRPTWLAAIRRYLVVVSGGNLVWEAAQLPLYTLWRTDSARAIVRAILHCTAGDVVIAVGALILALAAVGNAHWPVERAITVAVAVVAIGVAYTIGSEYVNITVRRSWAYSEWMPTLPWIGTGLAPLAQWVAVPATALLPACRGTDQ
jgi:hypothetical protein